MIKTGNKLFGLPCYCGHDCSKCVTYIATQTNNEDLRRQAQSFYKESFGLDIPLEKFYCNGGRSKNVFELCKECPFKKCCIERGIIVKLAVMVIPIILRTLIKLFMIIKHCVLPLKKRVLLLICLNTAMKTEHSIINTGMNLMENRTFITF